MSAVVLSVLRQAAAGLRILLLMTVLCGLAYPVVIWGVAQTAFHDRANGSLVHAGGRVVGSSLIGQDFRGPLWFHPRPGGYDPLATGGSNLGPSSARLLAEVRLRRSSVARAEHVPADEVPPDPLTGSASGLDPHISPEYARRQVTRVARAHGLTEQQVRELVDDHVQGRTLGFLGQERVNVLRLNLALAAKAG
ncbi:potassium-transporting ATPase subunit KdpC [Streptomyces xiamenensis]|uniref:potassium-transporting ATPase subunit KdpC n=1 Tax=Streptomyces xiamenensis TaxID=408015 RepID=UPI0037D1ED41